MEMSTRDKLMKKLLDAQENVRDYEMFSKQVDNEEVDSIFKIFAEESGMHARQLKELMDRYEE